MVITDAVAIALLSAKPTCSGTAAQFTPAGLQDHAQIKAFTAPTRFSQSDYAEKHKRAGLLENTAARGAKPSWSPAKDKCDQIRERKQMQTQLHAHTPHNTRVSSLARNTTIP